MQVSYRSIVIQSIMHWGIAGQIGYKAMCVVHLVDSEVD